MASFQFPDPTVQQTVTNTDTGAIYQWQADPGKWVLTVPNYDTEYVNVSGDTMTGPLIIDSTEELAQDEALLYLDNSNGNANTGAIIHITGESSSNLFNIYEHAISANTQWFTIFTPGNPSSRGQVGFQIRGKTTGSPANPNFELFYQIRNNSTSIADSLRYDGLIEDEKDLVTKSYVDASNLLEGGVISGSGGSVDQSGNLTVQQSSTDSETGRIYLKDSSGSGANISLYGPSGGIDMKGILSFTGSSDTKTIRVYGASNPSLRIRTGPEASSVATRLTIGSTEVTSAVNFKSDYGISGQNISASGTLSSGANASIGTTLSVGGDSTFDGKITLAGEDQGIYSTGKSNNSVNLYSGTTHSAAFGATYCSFRQPVTSNEGIRILKNGIQVDDGTSTFKKDVDAQGLFTFTSSNPIKFNSSNNQYIDVKQKLLFYGLNSDGTRPSWEAFSVGPDTTSPGLSKFMMGKRMYWQSSTTYQTGDVKNYMTNSTFGRSWSYYDNDTDDNLISQLSAAEYIVNVPTKMTDTLTCNSAAGQFGLMVDGSGVTQNQLWTTPNPATFAIKTGIGSSTQGQHNIFVYGGGSGNSYSLRLSKNSNYGQSDLQSAIYAGCDSSGNVKVQAYTTWGTNYANVDTLTDTTVVTLGLLKAKGLITTATYSSTGSYDPNNDVDTLTSTQNSVEIPAQAQFNGRTTTGRGFTLTGCTTDQPTNTSAVCLELYHPITAPAQLLYKGETTGDPDTVQTKASVDAAIQAAIPSPGSWNFSNSNDPYGSTLTGYFSMAWRKDGDVVSLIVKAVNASSPVDPVVAGDIVGVLPTGYRPALDCDCVFTAINRTQDATAMMCVHSDGTVSVLSVTGSDYRFGGQATFSTHGV